MKVWLHCGTCWLHTQYELDQLIVTDSLGVDCDRCGPNQPCIGIIIVRENVSAELVKKHPYIRGNMEAFEWKKQQKT